MRPDPASGGPYDRTLWVLVDVGLWQTANLFVTREIFDGSGASRIGCRFRPGS